MNNKILDCIRFEDFSDMLDNIFEAIDESEDYNSATIVGKYKEISEILNLVISCYAVEIGDITLCSEDSNGYKDEYALAIFNDEDRGVVVCCEPLKTDRGYRGYGGDVVYILDNCNSKVQYACEDEAKFVVVGEDECERDESYDCCECCNDEVDKPHIINISVNLDADEADDIIRKFRNNFYKEVVVFNKLLDF